MDDFEDRIEAARAANLALYLDDPSPESAHLLRVFEETVQSLRKASKVSLIHEPPLASMSIREGNVGTWSADGETPTPD